MSEQPPSKERVPGPQDPRPPGCRCGDNFDPKCPAGHSSAQRPSKERDKTQDALGELYGWLIDLANESSPYDSQMLMKAASIVGDRLATDSAISTEIANLRRDNRRWENAHKILIADNDRLRRQVGELSIHAEKWVKRALTREMPHCSSCSCPPYEAPEPTHFAFLIKRPRDKEAWPTIFTSRERATEYPDRASPVVPVCLTQPPGDDPMRPTMFGGAPAAVVQAIADALVSQTDAAILGSAEPPEAGQEAGI